ncbi:PRC-barrel domain-containing protein [Roseococcus sp. DSY-14]|uniref:PRC-barrel domain-containing protein n=1 Tax=Roseococcus sp. DSY-14 TaxID=3369650 RepID=UPI00387B1901
MFTRATQVLGATVFGADEAAIGTVSDLLINDRSGLVTAAVIEAGGFLGLGTEAHEVAWQRLVWDERLGGYLLPDLLPDGPAASLSPA